MSQGEHHSCATADEVMWDHIAAVLAMRTHAFPLDQPLAEQLSFLGRSVVVAKGTLLFAQGGEPDAIYVLESGRARLTLADENGAPKLKLTAAAGSILGLSAVFANLPYSMGAELAAASDVVVISRGLLLDAARQDGELCLKLLRLLGEQVHLVRHLFPAYE